MLRGWSAKYGVLVLIMLGVQVWNYRGVPPRGLLLAMAIGFALGALVFNALPAAVRWLLWYDRPDASARRVRPRGEPG